MTKNLLIEPINDPLEVHRLVSLIDDVVESPFHLRLEWLERNHLVAVPVESASHFYEQEAEWLSDATREIGCNECFAVATEPLENSVLVFRVPTTAEAFLEFSRECFSLNYVLIPENKSFAVLCTSRDYYVVSGSREFVKRAVGSSIPTARKMFFRFGNDPSWPKTDRENFKAIAKRYEMIERP